MQGRITGLLFMAALLVAMCMPAHAAAQEPAPATVPADTVATVPADTTATVVPVTAPVDSVVVTSPVTAAAVTPVAEVPKSKKEQRRAAKAERKKSKEPLPVEHFDYKVEHGKIQQISPIVLKDTVTQTVVLPTAPIPADSSAVLLSKKEQRRLDRALYDSTHVRYSPIFRDTLPISRMCAISLVVPGFSQLHNQQYWKIPIAYASLAGMIWGYTAENKPYQKYKKQYDYLIAYEGGTQRTPELDEAQTQMIRYNTRRQLFMAGIYAAWVYFVCDGAVNYPGTTSSVKKATTLSTILPGAGQIYNKSYWKVPFVLGGFATMAYVIDWNNRGFQRFKLAYDLVTDGNPDTHDEFNGRYTGDFLKRYRDNYRRNRDLCIILTGGLYLLNIIDAHVDSQLKDYDISDDLSMTLEPSMTNFYSMRSSRLNLPGFTFSIRF